MGFFKLSHDSSHEQRWPVAVAIHPTSHEVAWHCPLCGHAASYPSGTFDVTVEGGLSFPDVLRCGAYPFLIVSERVIRAWEKGGVTSLRSFRVRVKHVIESQVQITSAPVYYRIEATGECMTDFSASGAAITAICPRCGTIKMNVPYIKKFALLSGSWDGSPLFRDNRFFPRITFCTDVAKEIADTEAFSNIRFQAL